MRSLRSAVPAAPRSPVDARAAGQSSATTANSCGIPTRRVTQHGNKGPKPFGWGASGRPPSATAKKVEQQVRHKYTHLYVQHSPHARKNSPHTIHTTNIYQKYCLKNASLARLTSLGDDIKPCPRCAAYIIKMNDGSCNHMTCAVCGCEFCWLCMKEISDLHYLRWDRHAGKKTAHLHSVVFTVVSLLTDNFCCKSQQCSESGNAERKGLYMKEMSPGRLKP